MAHAWRYARAAAAAASRALGHVATRPLPARIARASVGADALAVSATRLVADGLGAIGARPARSASAPVGARTRAMAARTGAVVQAAWLATRRAAVALVAAAHVGNEAPAVPPAVDAVGNLARTTRVPRGARACTPIAIAHAMARAVVKAAHPHRAIGAAPAGRAQALANCGSRHVLSSCARTPSHPSMHTRRALRTVTWPEHPRSHCGLQVSLAYPTSQEHVPLMHWPCAWQCDGHGSSLSVMPSCQAALGEADEREPTVASAKRP